MGNVGLDGINSVQFEAMQQLIGAGDMESALIAFGIERAQTMEKLVKGKIADMRARNAEIQELQRAMQELRSLKPGDDEEGKNFTGTLSDSTKATLEKYPELGKFVRAETETKYFDKQTGQEVGNPFPWAPNVEKREVPTGNYELTRDKGFEDMMANFQSQIDEMTSNDQLDMIQLQSVVSKQNNAIEMVSNLHNKFAQIKDKIVGNMR